MFETLQCLCVPYVHSAASYQTFTHKYASVHTHTHTQAKNNDILSFVIFKEKI